MPSTTIEGGCVYKKTITDACRENRGDWGCIDVVTEELKHELSNVLDRTQLKLGWKIHVAVSVERPA